MLTIRVESMTPEAMRKYADDGISALDSWPDGAIIVSVLDAEGNHARRGIDYEFELLDDDDRPNWCNRMHDALARIFGGGHR